jgi:hypothetical protein
MPLSRKMTSSKKQMGDIKMRQKTHAFTETGSCFDTTKVAGIKVRTRVQIMSLASLPLIHHHRFFSPVLVVMELFR